ncbi:hypothetical protein ERJ75_001705800 [Trypanosoma vivax]|nr:hypothetical protein ERJ75_001705800 [Trypanosoma vivax]
MRHEKALRVPVPKIRLLFSCPFVSLFPLRAAQVRFLSCFAPPPAQAVWHGTVFPLVLRAVETSPSRKHHFCVPVFCLLFVRAFTRVSSNSRQALKHSTSGVLGCVAATVSTRWLCTSLSSGLGSLRWPCARSAFPLVSAACRGPRPRRVQIAAAPFSRQTRRPLAPGVAVLPTALCLVLFLRAAKALRARLALTWSMAVCAKRHRAMATPPSSPRLIYCRAAFLAPIAVLSARFAARRRLSCSAARLQAVPTRAEHVRAAGQALSSRTSKHPLRRRPLVDECVAPRGTSPRDGARRQRVASAGGLPWKRGGRAIAVGGNNRRSERPAPPRPSAPPTSGRLPAVALAMRCSRQLAGIRDGRRRRGGEASDVRPVMLCARGLAPRARTTAAVARAGLRADRRARRHSWPATVGRDFAANAVQGAGSSRRLTASRRQKHGGDALIGRFAR